MDIPWQIVVASSSLENRRKLMTVLMQLGMDPICVSSVSQCRELLLREQVNLIFCDRQLSDGYFADVVAASQAAKSRPSVVLACRHNNVEYQKAIESGTFGVISGACHPSDIEWMVIQAKREFSQRPPAQPGPQSAPGPEKIAPVEPLSRRAAAK